MPDDPPQFGDPFKTLTEALADYRLTCTDDYVAQLAFVAGAVAAATLIHNHANPKDRAAFVALEGIGLIDSLVPPEPLDPPA